MTKTTLIQSVSRVFSEQWGYSAAQLVQAPVVLSIMGSTLELDDGLSLSCALDYQVVAAAALREDNLFRIIHLDDLSHADVFAMDMPISLLADSEWANDVRQVVKELQSVGYPFFGVDVVIGHNVPSDLPVDRRMSTNVVIAQLLKTLYALPLTQQQIAFAAQKALKVRRSEIGNMNDAFVAAESLSHHGLMIDARSQQITPMVLPESMSLMVLMPQLPTQETMTWNDWRQDCQHIARFMGVKAVRDMTPYMFDTQKGLLEGKVVKHIHHIMAENDRTQSLVQALKYNDFSHVGEILTLANNDYCYAFELNDSDQDILAHLVTDTVNGLGGARVMNCGEQLIVVAIVPTESIEAIKHNIAESYESITGISVNYVVSSASKGAGKVSMVEMATAA